MLNIILTAKKKYKEHSQKLLFMSMSYYLYVKRHISLYIFLVLPVIYLIVFRYLPMYGLKIAFEEFNPVKGYSQSTWIGFENFSKFFSSYIFWRLIGNTLGISIYQLLAGFPVPIILAICINECRSRFLKKTVQMVTYAPYFISVVVLVSIMTQILSTHYGLINNIIQFFNGKAVNFMGEPRYFKTLFVWSGIWQNMGYSSIIYIAALSSIDPQIQEAANIDGASKIKRIWHIDMPGIMPTAVTLLILSAGQIMNIGFQKVYLMQNSMNISKSEIISTYVYKVGLLGGDFSYSTAVGLFNSFINLMILVAVNNIAKKLKQTSIW